jgi:hypothetical protein
VVAGCSIDSGCLGSDLGVGMGRMVECRDSDLDETSRVPLIGWAIVDWCIGQGLEGIMHLVDRVWRRGMG